MRIGIAGTGGIVERCLATVSLLEEVNCKAICARPQSLSKAEALAIKYNIPHVYTDYQAMLVDAEVDFIYIGVINSVHFTYAKQALLAGKHIICEKPLTSHSDEFMQLEKLAKERNLFFFEAITLIYSPNYQFIKENIAKIGAIRLVQANYSQYSSRYDRYLAHEVLPAFDPQLSGGALYDINIYNLHMVIGLFGAPQQINYFANIGFNGIDTSGVALLKYSGFIATCIGAKDSSSVSGVLIQGEKGYIHLKGAPNICGAVELVVADEKQQYNGQIHAERMSDELLAFAKMYRNNDLVRCYKYLEHSRLVMAAVTKARLSAEIKFSADRTL